MKDSVAGAVCVCMAAVSETRNNRQGSFMDEKYQGSEEDVKQLHSMGYAQELSRRMSGFSNFAISFSIICIIAGGITAFQAGFSAGGGGSIGLGWPLACGFSPDRRRFHGTDRLGLSNCGRHLPLGVDPGRARLRLVGRLVQLLGLVFVVSSVDVGLWQLLFVPLIGQNYPGWDPANFIPIWRRCSPSRSPLAPTGSRPSPSRSSWEPRPC